jgi:hypothetical protein
MKPRSIHIFPLALAALLLCGCVSHRSTVYRDVERVPVEFESDAAARLFYETLSKGHSSDKSESTSNVSIPFVFAHKRTVVTGRNTEFNRSVAACDTNRDGRITEQEVRIFANQKP